MAGAPDLDRLYEIAEGQAGYFTARQASTAGFSWERLSYYAKTGRFRRAAHGIYRLTHFPASPFEDLHIALLRTGPDSVISHESAVAVYELSDVMPAEAHVIVPRTASRRRKGIRLHTNRLRPDEVTTRAGLRITTAPRTIADLAASGLAGEQVQMAIQEALQRGLITQEALLIQAARRGGRVEHMMRHSLESLEPV